MSKIEEKQKKQPKKKTEDYFYQKWWFWVVIGVIFAGTWALLFIKDIDLRSSIIGICGVWGSTIATIFIGIIAARQNERYTFISKKQEYIDGVREEERKFLADFAEIGLATHYIELAIDIVYTKGADDPQKESLLMAKQFQMANNLATFMHNISAYEYSPVYAKEMWDKSKEMGEYLWSEMNLAKMPEPLDEKFREKGTEFAEFIMDWAKAMQEIKTKYILGFQLLINAFSKCNDMKALNRQAAIISKKTQKMREEVALFNYFEKKEQNKEQEKND